MPNEFEEICKRHALRETLTGHLISVNADDYMQASKDRGFLLNMIEELEQQL